MAEDQVTVSFVCPNCEGGEIEIDPGKDDPNSKVSCANPNCDTVFDQTWGEINDAAAKHVMDEMTDKLLAPFEKSKHWKVTRR